MRSRLASACARVMRGALSFGFVVLLVAGVVALAVAVRGPDQSETTRQHTSVPPESRGNSPRAATVRTVDRLLAAAPVMPGSEPRGSAPAPEMRDAYSSPDTPNLVRRFEWFVAPGDTHEVLAYFAAHRPTGVATAAGTGLYSDHGVVKARSASFPAIGAQWRHPIWFTALELSIEVTPLGDSVGVAVYADAIWLDPRPDNARIPLTVAVVRAVVARHPESIAGTHAAPTVRKTLGRRDARALARLINSLPSNQRGEYSCPPPIGTDTLTFNDAARTTVAIGVGGCGVVEISKDRVELASVGFGSARLPAVDAAVMRAMDLPPGYGR